MTAFVAVFARELEAVYALMCKIGGEFHAEASARRRNFDLMFPASDARCVLCRQPHGCGCMAAPLKRERALVLTVPAAVGTAGSVIVKLRAVNRATRDAWKECRTHAGMSARVAQYRRDAYSLARVRAAESVVGPAVHCYVGECSRCHGTIHECGCRMFTCECAVCIWKRTLMRAMRVSSDVGSFDNHLRIPAAEVDAVAPSGATLSNPNMYSRYLTLRSASYRHFMSFTTFEAVSADQAVRGYDPSLDSDDAEGDSLDSSDVDSDGAGADTDGDGAGADGED